MYFLIEHSEMKLKKRVVFSSNMSQKQALEKRRKWDERERDEEKMSVSVRRFISDHACKPWRRAFSRCTDEQTCYNDMNIPTPLTSCQFFEKELCNVPTSHIVQIFFQFIVMQLILSKKGVPFRNFLIQLQDLVRVRDDLEKWTDSIPEYK